MKVIGITGGVGSGKSAVLEAIREACKCEIIIADEVAHELEKKGHRCYDKLKKLLGDEILDTQGEIDKKKMAAMIFAKDSLLEEVNAIIHPEVKCYIKEKIEKAAREKKIDFLFIEAALLIEDGYKEICDELWYIWVKEEIRIQRLVVSRGYSLEKIRQIMDNQLSEEQFRTNCDKVIDNNGDLEATRKQIIGLVTDR